MIGMMWQSRKALDLLRDPRLSLHSIVTNWEGSEGDFKLYGIGEDVRDEPRRQALFTAIEAAHGEAPDPDGSGNSDDFHVFAVDIDRAGFVRFGESTWEAWSWDPRHGLRKQEQPSDRPIRLGGST